MPTFFYKTTDEDEKVITGTLTAASEKEAESLLKNKKLKVLVLKTKKEKNKGLSLSLANRFPLQEKINLCRYLAVMIDAGLPLGESFEILTQGATNKTVKQILQDISFGLTKGQSLYSSFGKYPKHFDEVFLAMVKTGETSGTLNDSFRHLANQYHQKNDLQKKVMGALLYPGIIVTLMVALGILMLTFVLPKLGKVYLRLNLELPTLTRVLLNLSLFMEKNFVFLLIGLFVLAIGFLLFIKSKPGKNIFYLVTSKTPVVKKILLEYNLARFTQSLSSLLKASVPIGQSLEIASKSLKVANSEKLTQNFGEKINQGVSLSIAFAEAKIFPPMMTEMVAVGEKTGNLDKFLLDISTFYQEEIENSLKNFIALLEPLLMIAVGVAVGIMVFAFITPIYSLIGKLQG